jgi:acyl dehydratase
VAGLYFEDFEVGREFETAGRTITESDIVLFAGITGDWTELHTNAEFAKSTIFGQRIAHGALIFSITTGLLVRLGFVEKTVLAFYGVDRLRFTKPVFIGDTIKAVGKVVEKEDKGGYGVVTIECKTVKQTGEVVMVCNLKLAVKKR